MNEGSRFYSDSRRCYIELQTDGNLVLYRAFDRKAFWESGTHGKDIPNVQFQSDGNLVLYDRGGSAVWSSYTDNKGAKRLVMQDDGNFVMYDGKEKAVWSTHTSGIGACRGSVQILPGKLPNSRNFQGKFHLKLQPYNPHNLPHVGPEACLKNVKSQKHHLQAYKDYL